MKRDADTESPRPYLCYVRTKGQLILHGSAFSCAGVCRVSGVGHVLADTGGGWRITLPVHSAPSPQDKGECPTDLDNFLRALLSKPVNISYSSKMLSRESPCYFCSSVMTFRRAV